MNEPRIRKCPPGNAIGAGDIHEWASRRLVGQPGVYKAPKKKPKPWRPGKAHRHKMREAARRRASYDARMQADLQAYERAESKLIKGREP
jgi:hypothetical protein